MQVETFECEELKNSEATTMAVDAEAIELAEKLGLVGQKLLTNPDTLTRQPYREMTAMEYFVWRSVCPEVSKAKDYKLGPIPLRVLQVMAYVKELGIYEDFEIWHAKSVKEDPILVGIPYEGRYTVNRHLIARWGD